VGNFNEKNYSDLLLMARKNFSVSGTDEMKKSR
jgi:hypothetical protein